MKLRTCLLAIVIVMFFASIAWSEHFAIIFEVPDPIDTLYGYTALQDAIDSANANSDIDSIYYWGDYDTVQIASSDLFEITADNLNIVYLR